MDFGDEDVGGLGAEVAVDGGLEFVEVLDGAFDWCYGGEGVSGMVEDWGERGWRKGMKERGGRGEGGGEVPSRSCSSIGAMITRG